MRSLNQKITNCSSCARLRKYCEKIGKEKRRAYQDQNYWAKPITGFGDTKAKILIVGLAPAAHGANRTGRVFTGDRSGLWLYRALHKSGFANQSTYQHSNDGLKLKDVYITCVVKCAPPGNKPLPIEIRRCSPYLEQELKNLKEVKIILVLGQIGLNAIWPLLISSFQEKISKPKLKHGGRIRLPDDRWLIMSFHPSQQNTFTGRLTEPMFDSIFSEAKKLLIHPD